MPFRRSRKPAVVHLAGGPPFRRAGIALLLTSALASPATGGCPAVGLARTPDATESPSRLGLDRRALVALLESERREHDLPGLRAAVRLPDGSIVSASVGWADVERRIRLDDDIGMPGGSTGKTFVATLAMLLVEDGTLALDDPAGRWLGSRPWFSRLPNAAEMEMRHLLSHSAGIVDYPSGPKFLFSMIGRVLRHGSAYYSPEELIGFALDRRPLNAPGEGFHYTDIGYLVLGRLLEEASGRSYYDLLQDRLLRPSGLDRIRPMNTAVLEDVAMAYVGGARAIRDDGTMKVDPSSEWTGGGLITDPTSLVEFLGGLAAGRIVRPESLERMICEGWRDPDGSDPRYGLGLFVEREGRAFGHGGRWSGYRTHVGHDVASGVTIAAQTNRGGVDPLSIVRRIGDLVHSRPDADSPSDPDR